MRKSERHLVTKIITKKTVYKNVLSMALSNTCHACTFLYTVVTHINVTRCLSLFHIYLQKMFNFSKNPGKEISTHSLPTISVSPSALSPAIAKLIAILWSSLLSITAP